MRNRLSVLVLFSLVFAVGCTTVNTMPEPVSPSDAVRRYDLEIPQDLEIRSVDFSATAFSEVSGTGGMTTSSVGGRAFVKVHAVHRTTGEHFLLLYEDAANRRQPVQVIRFLASAERVRPDSTR